MNGTRQTLEPSKQVNISTYVDASYAVHVDEKSHTGEAHTLCKGIHRWGSWKQSIVTKSSTEAEVVGWIDTISPAVGSRMFLMHQGYDMGLVIVH